VPRLARSSRKNAQSQLLSGNVSNGNSGRDRTGPRPQMRPRHIGSCPEMSPFPSPRLVPRCLAHRLASSQSIGALIPARTQTKTPPPRREAAFCLIMTRKEELLCPWQAWQRPTLPGLKP
jgi:hypothetical protein